tara:strand:- start:2410 stop:3417 length:1008 start_codon:yes stop_codon:yes gene_type:complete
MLKIENISYYLPNEPVSNKDIIKKNPGWNLNDLNNRTGVNTRYYANKNETALDMSIEACKIFFENYNSKKDKIDALIFCTQSNDYIMPPNSSLLHGILGLSEDVFAFDFNLACSGYIYGLAIANGLLSTNMASNILLVNADTYSKYINEKDRSTKILFGDAAAVSYIKNSNQNKGIIDIQCSTSGENYKKFIIPSGGIRYPKSKLSCVPIKDKSGNIRTDEDIHMDGMGIFAFVNSKVPKQIKSILKKNSLNLSDIDLFIFHQASKLAIDSLIKILKIDSKKVYINIDKVGNTVSASIPIALKDALSDGKIKDGDKILCCGFGVGLSWGTCIIQH